jgi:putative transposase
VSEITDQLWEDYQAFCTRDLSSIDVSYLFLDGIYESLRRYGAKEGVLAAWCITTDGREMLLHLAVGNKGPRTATEFMPDMVAPGTEDPDLGHLRWRSRARQRGRQGFLSEPAIRCWYHKLSHIRAKLPAEGAEEVLAHVRGGARHL